MRATTFVCAGICALAIAYPAHADPLKIRGSWVAPVSNWASIWLEKKDLAVHYGKSYVYESARYAGTPPMITAMANNELEIRVQAIDENKLLSGFQKIANRITLGLLMAALIVSAAMLMQIGTTFRILGYPGIAMIFFALAAVGGVGLMLQIMRDDRKA